MPSIMAFYLNFLYTNSCVLIRKFLHKLYSSSSIIRMTQSKSMRWAGHVSRMGMKECIEEFLGKVEGKRPLGIPTR
jgi:hypothetical protein